MTRARLWVVEFDWDYGWAAIPDAWHTKRDAIAEMSRLEDKHEHVTYRVSCYERIEPKKRGKK
jgi:hypothetical protein